MANHPNRGGARPSPTDFEVQAARIAAGHTQAAAAATVFVTLSAWQRWEQGERRMPPGLRELYSLKTGAPMYAIYDSDAIYGIGESIAAALIDAGMGPLVSLGDGDKYRDGVVDLSAARLLRPDDESENNRPKLRRCSVDLYRSVMGSGGEHVEFDIADSGVLDLARDSV